MKKILIALLVIPLSCTITPRHKFNKDDKALLIRTIKRFPKGTQFSFAFIENGKVTYYGLENSESGPKFIKNYLSGFEIGSITKLFTSTILVEAEREYSFNKGENINNYIDIGLPEGITFINLANHTSGLPEMPKGFDWMSNIKNPLKYMDEKYLTDFIKYEVSPADANKNFQYSSIGVALLGYSLEELTGEKYDNLLKKYILDPYNMNSTVLHHKEYSGKIVQGYNPRGDEVPNWDFDIMAPAGSVVSNVYDLSKFAIAHMDKDNIITQTHNTTFSITSDFSMGIGWFITRDNKGNRYLYHQGGTNGYSSIIKIDPSNQKGIILLTNVSPLRSSYIMEGLVQHLF